MSDQHTQGRLQAIHGSYLTIVGTNESIGRCGTHGPHLANARRLAACWNYCEGLDTDGMELAVSMNRPIKTFVDESIKKELELTAQRDQLRRNNNQLRALIMKLLDTELAELACTGSDAPVEDLLGRIQNAIANTNGASTPPQSADYKAGFRAGIEYQESVEVDLLEALVLLVAGIENSVSDTYIPLVKAQAAIANATGAPSPKVSRNGTTARFYPVQHLPADDTEGGAA